jgi:magnesium-protoporphyrin IX monomethyl ester (oxidative) cyclase
MRQTNRTAARAFPVVFVLDGSRYFQLRDQLVDTYRQLKASAGQPLRQLGLRARFGWLLLQQFLQPMQPCTEVCA